MDDRIIYLGAGIGIVLLLLLISTLIISKKKTKKVKQLSIEFVDRLRLALGENNLIEVRAEHERVKFVIKDYKKVDINEMKALSYKGVFVKSNEVTATFEYQPKEIIDSLKKQEDNYGKNI